MHIAYFDESGDDGYPAFSSPIFVLTSVYLHYLEWQDIYKRLQDFRRSLSSKYRLPVKFEMHTQHFLRNKYPFRSLHLSDATRIDIMNKFCDLIANLDLKFINIAIVKPRIRSKNYKVLDTALKYLVQRIENDLSPDTNKEAKFLIITDPGRVGKMRATTRRMQKINYIPSKFGSPYRKEISTLIEDPMQKESDQSYFIQIADLVTTIVYLYVVCSTGIGAIPSRMRKVVNRDLIFMWLEKIKPSLNLAAGGDDPYGVVFHPKL